MDVVHSCTAAVRGYHYYKQFWKHVENEELHCYHEKYNLYDEFAIKTVHKNGETVGHLPREISRVTNFFLDRGVSMHIKLPSSHYRRSPLVQGGMEIPCTLFCSMTSILKNAQQLVKERYTKPANEKILDSFITEAFLE